MPDILPSSRGLSRQPYPPLQAQQQASAARRGLFVEQLVTRFVSLGKFSLQGGVVSPVLTW